MYIDGQEHTVHMLWQLRMVNERESSCGPVGGGPLALSLNHSMLFHQKRWARESRGKTLGTGRIGGPALTQSG